MYVCMYVCMYLCMYICMYVCIYVCMYVWESILSNIYKDVDDLGLRWDLIKMEIRGYTIKYSKTKAKIIKYEEIDLQNKANEL